MCHIVLRFDTIVDKREIQVLKLWAIYDHTTVTK